MLCAVLILLILTWHIATHHPYDVTHSLPFPAKICDDVPACKASCSAELSACKSAATNGFDYEDCATDYRHCLYEPATANKEDVDNEGAGLRGSDSKTIAAIV